MRNEPWGAGVPKPVREASDKIIDAIMRPDDKIDWAAVRATLVELWVEAHRENDPDQAEPRNGGRD
jgi:hypothetical protein